MIILDDKCKGDNINIVIMIMIILEDEGKGVALPVQVERGFPPDVVRQVYRPLETFTHITIHHLINDDESR